MLVETLVRATAIGVVTGGVVALETVRLTAGLRTDPGASLPLSGLLVTVYVGAAWVAALLLVALDRLGSGLGLPERRLLGARVLWTVGATLLLLAVLNESARTLPLVETWKRPLRVALALGAALLIGSGLRRDRGAARWARNVEAALAGIGLLALVGGIAYFAIPTEPPGPGGGAPVDGAWFHPEPPHVLLPRPAPAGPRVILVGLDGASWDRIDAGIAAGRLPTFARLVSSGIRAPLKTLRPTYSPTIWTTVATGVPPETHGIRDFYVVQVPRLRIERLGLRRSADLAEETLDALGELRRVPVTSTLRRRKAVWNLADEAGLRSAVLGFWATWPPEPLRHGLVVSDHASLARRREWLDRRKTSTLDPVLATTHPPELESRLARLQRAPESVSRQELARFVEVDDRVWEEFQAIDRFSKGVPLSAFRSTHLNDAFYLRAALEIWREERPDLMLVYAKAIDELSHFFYEASVPEATALGWSEEEISRYGAVVDRAYAWTDRELAPLMDSVDADGDTLLVVVSDHGWARERDGSYDHNEAPPGILVLYGAGVCRSGCRPLAGASVFDVAPTLLERLHLPLSEELTGRPLVEAFQSPHEIRRVRRYGGPRRPPRAIASERDAELTEKLEALGYLE